MFKKEAEDIEDSRRSITFRMPKSHNHAAINCRIIESKDELRWGWRRTRLNLVSKGGDGY